LSLVARSLRFAATCALLFWAGPRLKTLIERRLGMAFVLMAVMVVGGLMLGKYVL
ncbi:TPA: DedA family protein, partial [Pseudomonas aeruginosa]|nr:DedA family protein [Pseudomonas aeruginosa]